MPRLPGRRRAGAANAYNRRDYDRARYQALRQEQQQDIGNLAANFHHQLYRLAYRECLTCKEVLLGDQDEAVDCRQCRLAPEKFGAANNMDPGRDVPDCLRHLTLAETMLIAQVNPIMAVFLLPRGNQFATRGHVISFPQDLQGFVTRLPRAVANLDILIVQRSRGDALPPREFRVRRRMILEALQWLQLHNRYYHDIVIDQGLLHQLPVDDVIEIPQDHHIVCRAVATEDQGPADATGPRDGDDNTVQSFCPTPINERTEADAINQFLQWPTVDREHPLNEFNTEGLIARAFPCLFPTGAADLNAARTTKVTAVEYFRHMCQYVDGRFREDPRFIFYSQNCVDRWNALSVGRVYAQRHVAEAALTIHQLRDLVNSGDNSIPKQILRFGSHIRGTKQYWFARGEELTDLIGELGPSHLFFTFSSADTLWPDLHRLLPDGAGTRSAAVARQPWLVEEYCVQRFKLFFEAVITPYLKVKDYWYRFEFQHRGSVHVHGMLWLDSPPFEQMTLDNIKDAADRLITCNNPAVADGVTADGTFFYPVAIHPSSVDYNTVGAPERIDDQKSLVNTLQRHVRCVKYCEKTMANGEKACRFGFPVPICAQTTVTKGPQKPDGSEGKIVVEYQRNDTTVNKHNLSLLQAWRGNMDCSIVTNQDDCARYIAKYTAKAEPASASYIEVYKSMISEELRDEESFTASVQKLLLKTVGTRDRSIQESCHLLSQRPLVHCSRAFVTATFDGETVMEEVNGPGSSPILKYLRRPAAFEDESFGDIMRHYTMRNYQGRVVMAQRSKPAVIKFRPVLPSAKEAPGYERYCRQQLALRKPFRAFADLRTGFNSEVEAFEALGHEDQLPMGEEVVEAARMLNAEDYPPRVRVRPDTFIMGLEDEEAVRPRAPVEQGVVDWKSSIADLPMATLGIAKNFLATAKAAGVQATEVEQCNVEGLNGQQRRAFELIVDSVGQRCVIVSGTAGTGKSYLLGCLRQRLGQSAVVAAPTGVAAQSVQGRTLHSVLQLGNGRGMVTLSGGALDTLQTRWGGVKFLFIDEMSMVGLKMLSDIDERLKAAIPTRKDQPFGGVSVVLLGDFGQLTPVGDTVLYTSQPGSDPKCLAGFALFRCFGTTVTLTELVRQANDPAFATLLQRLRQGESTGEDYDLLADRVVGRVRDPPATTVRLYPTTAQVREYNTDMLLSMVAPVAVIESRNSSARASHCSSDMASGLENSVSVCTGARVMLKTNLWTEAGLVNGSLGTVLFVVYINNDGPPALPDCVVVKFPSYKGPAFLTDYPKSFPVCPLQRCWRSGIQNHTRTGLPLMLAWSLTIHKAQGLTLDSCHVDLGTKEISPGMSFVALSRVRRLTDLTMAPFAYSRIRDLGANPTMRMRKALEVPREE